MNKTLSVYERNRKDDVLDGNCSWLWRGARLRHCLEKTSFKNEKCFALRTQSAYLDVGILHLHVCMYRVSAMSTSCLLLKIWQNGC